MREDLIEAFGGRLSQEQEDALLATPEYIDFAHGELGVEEFRSAGMRYLKAMENTGGDWRDGYYEALSLTMCLRADRKREVFAAKAALPAGGLSSPEEVEAWIGAQETTDAKTDLTEGAPSVARVSVREWRYERDFLWRSPSSVLGVLALAGEKLRRFGWEADEARGYVLTGRVPAYSRVSGRLTWDTQEFPCPRIKLSVDASASPEEVLAAFSAQRARLMERVRPFEERALELRKHTIRLPESSGQWKSSMEERNELFPETTWRFRELRKYKAAARRVHEAIRNRVSPDERRSPINVRHFLGW